MGTINPVDQDRLAGTLHQVGLQVPFVWIVYGHSVKSPFGSDDNGFTHFLSSPFPVKNYS
jgi:hypothetical protein